MLDQGKRSKRIRINIPGIVMITLSLLSKQQCFFEVFFPREIDLIDKKILENIFVFF